MTSTVMDETQPNGADGPMPLLTPLSADKLSWRSVAAHLLQTPMMFLIIGGLLFLSAGQWNWLPEVW